MSTLFAVVERPMIAVRNYGYRFIGTPVHPGSDAYPHPRTGRCGSASTLGHCACCLLRGHGSVVAGNSIAEVFLDSLELEENARSAVYAACLGALQPITPEEAKLLRASYAKNDYRAAKIWEHYQEKAKLAGFSSRLMSGASMFPTEAVTANPLDRYRARLHNRRRWFPQGIKRERGACA